MIITEISPQKHKGRYNLFVDDAFYSGIDDEVIVLYGLKVGKDIDKDKLEDIVVSSEKRRAFTKLLDIISRKECTEKEIKDKLVKKGYNVKGIELAIDMAKEYGYVNDVEFAKHFVGACGLKSVREIKNKLYLKGIDKKVIEECVSQIPADREYDNASALAGKYMKNKEVDKKTLSNLYNYLAKRGFSSDVCTKVLYDFKYDIFEWCKL